MLVLKLCTLLVAFCRSSWSLESSLSRGQRPCLLSDTEVSAQEGEIKVSWKKVEQRRLQDTFYIPLKVVNLSRKLQNSKVERGGGRSCAGEAASPLWMGRLSHLGAGQGERVYNPA